VEELPKRPARQLPENPAVALQIGAERWAAMSCECFGDVVNSFAECLIVHFGRDHRL
jgi:hypothetical protein